MRTIIVISAFAGALLARSATAQDAKIPGTTLPINRDVDVCARLGLDRSCWGVFGGTARPAGTYRSFARNGGGGGGLVQIALDRYWRARAEVATLALGRTPDGTGSATYDSNVGAATVSLVLEPRGGRPHIVNPYVLAGIGLYRLSVDYSIQSCSSACPTAYSRSGSFGGLTGGFGLRFAIPSRGGPHGFAAFAELRSHLALGTVMPQPQSTTTTNGISIGFLAH